jgi:hypothetical protein
MFDTLVIIPYREGATKGFDGEDEPCAEPQPGSQYSKGAVKDVGFMGVRSAALSKGSGSFIAVEPQ